MNTEQSPSPETMKLHGLRLAVDGGLKTEKFSPQKVKQLTGDDYPASLPSKFPQIIDRLLGCFRKSKKQGPGTNVDA